MWLLVPDVLEARVLKAEVTSNNWPAAGHMIPKQRVLSVPRSSNEVPMLRCIPQQQ